MLKKILVLGAVVIASTSAAHAYGAGDTYRGSAYAEGMCQSCHAITAKDAASPNAAAPPFKKISRAFASGDELATFINTQHPPMPTPTIHPEQADDILAYITSVKGSSPK